MSGIQLAKLMADLDLAADTALAGFTDYSVLFGDYDIYWVITGMCILLGTLISYQPQNGVFIYRRSNYGVNSFMAFVTNLGQGLVAMNILCLHVGDFAGMLQLVSDDKYHPLRVLSTFLTFTNMVLDWYTFKFVFVLNYIFVDTVPRPRRDERKIKIDVFWSRALVGLLMVIEIVLYGVFLGLICTHGFESKLLRAFGRTLGTMSSVANGIQYLPQIITTCRLRERGSYSLVTLGIIMVGGTINMFFMWFGQGEDWTTVLPVAVSITEQFILFVICVYFMIRKRVSRHGPGVLDEPLNQSGTSTYTPSDDSLIRAPSVDTLSGTESPDAERLLRR